MSDEPETPQEREARLAALNTVGVTVADLTPDETPKARVEDEQKGLPE